MQLRPLPVSFFAGSKMDLDEKFMVVARVMLMDPLSGPASV